MCYLKSNLRIKITFTQSLIHSFGQYECLWHADMLESLLGAQDTWRTGPAASFQQAGRQPLSAIKPHLDLCSVFLLTDITPNIINLWKILFAIVLSP